MTQTATGSHATCGPSLASTIGNGAGRSRTEPLSSAIDILESVSDLTRLLQPATDGAKPFIAHSRAMRQVIEQAHRIARSSATVLLTGESGTGKELIARMIHAASPRAAQPYARVNCAALSEHLVESELFGHERGAFTGAVESRTGRFESASGGTLLLDEISEIPVSLQAKLLRVLEEEEYQRVGSNETHRVDVRVIATTNRDLQEEVAAGTFRSDLYYRLNVLQLHLPPLRERQDDIPALVNYFLHCFQDESSCPLRGVSDEAVQVLTAYDWPGNVRQLRNVLHRLCVLSQREYIQPADLPELPPAAEPGCESLFNLPLEDVERRVILTTLRRCEGNKTATARQLGVTPRTLANKMKKYREQGHA